MSKECTGCLCFDKLQFDFDNFVDFSSMRVWILLCESVHR